MTKIEFHKYSQIKIQVETEDMHVMKLVDSVARIPKHLDLHFSDFSTNFYAFSKFAVLDSIVHVVFAN